MPVTKRGTLPPPPPPPPPRNAAAVGPFPQVEVMDKPNTTIFMPIADIVRGCAR